MKHCPECGYEFRSGWKGFHKHWWSKHDLIMSAEDALQAAKDNNYLDIRDLTIRKPKFRI